MTTAEQDERIRLLAEHAKAGGAPFGGKLNANIGEVIDAYQQAISDLQRELRAARA